MSKLIGVRVTEQEHETVQARARMAGCHNISSYVRQRILEDNSDTVLMLLQTVERRALEILARMHLPRQLEAFAQREKREASKEEREILLTRIKAKLLEDER